MTRSISWVAVAGVLAGCAQQAVKEGSSPKVPKAAIEKAADTKIPDAGADGEPASAAEPK